MKHLSIIMVLLLGLFTAASANALKLNFSKEADYMAWATYGNGKNTVGPIVFKGKSANLSLPKDAAKNKDLQVFVMDRTSGNVAIQPIIQGTESAGFVRSDFEYIRRVRLKITSGGKPVAFGRVSLQIHPNVSQNRMFDPTSDGIVEFENIPGGKSTVKISYGDNSNSSQDINISLDRDQPVFFAEVPVVGAPVISQDHSNSLKSKDAGTKANDSNSTREERSYGIGNGLMGFVFVIFILGIVYVILRDKGILDNLRKNLENQTPEAEVAASEPSQPQDPSICAFCGQKKDPVTGACACSVNSAPVGLPSSNGSRLVGIGGQVVGQIIPMAGGVTLGRDSDNTVVLASDSTVSRRHARITQENGSYTLSDEGSSNGTYVNGARVTQQILQSGDELRIGSNLFRVEG